METRPTLDKYADPKPSRPGWKAFVAIAAMVTAFISFVSVMQV